MATNKEKMIAAISAIINAYDLQEIFEATIEDRFAVCYPHDLNDDQLRQMYDLALSWESVVLTGTSQEVSRENVPNQNR